MGITEGLVSALGGFNLSLEESGSAIGDFIGGALAIIGQLPQVFKIMFLNAKIRVIKGVVAVAGLFRWLEDQSQVITAGMGNAFKGMWNGIISGFESGINAVISLLNKFIGAYNSIARKLGLGEIKDIKNVDFGNVKAELVDITKLQEKLKHERELSAIAQGNELGLTSAIHDKLEAQSKIRNDLTEFYSIQAGAGSEEVTKELTKQEQLVRDLQGMMLITNQKTGEQDIFNPGAYKTSAPGEKFGEFQSEFSKEQARRGGGVEINIENVNGLDPEEVARALKFELNTGINVWRYILTLK